MRALDLCCFAGGATKGLQRAGRFWSKVDRTGDCWMWTGGGTPYGKFAVTKRCVRGAHRVAYELARGPIPDGMLVCHSCDTPLCVRPDHLWLGTQSDNLRDSVAKGRFHRSFKPQRGELNNAAKLSDGDVARLRSDLAAGMRTGDVARKYNVHPGTVWAIGTGRRRPQ